MTISNIKISKFLSYVLRHNPDSINLTLDENGWAAVDELHSDRSKIRAAETARKTLSWYSHKIFRIDFAKWPSTPESASCSSIHRQRDCHEGGTTARKARDLSG